MKLTNRVAVEIARMDLPLNDRLTIARLIDEAAKREQAGSVWPVAAMQGRVYDQT